MSKSIWDNPAEEAAFEKWYKRAAKQFMSPVVEEDSWYSVETREGTQHFPADSSILNEILQAEGACEVEFIKSGYGARFIASGYMDATEWTVFQTEREAWEYLMEQDEGADEQEEEAEEDAEPQEGDYTTTDHLAYYQYGKLVVKASLPDDADIRLCEHMEAQQYWPNVWFISDHGNAILRTINKT